MVINVELEMILNKVVMIYTSIYLEEIIKKKKKFVQDSRCAGGWTLDDLFAVCTLALLAKHPEC
jgi:hypothetical protein